MCVRHHRPAPTHVLRFHKDDQWGVGVPDERYANVLRDLYIQMDGLVGRVMKETDDQTVLMVLSDHGFKPFRRAVELDRWLQQNGYLTKTRLPRLRTCCSGSIGRRRRGMRSGSAAFI